MAEKIQERLNGLEVEEPAGLWEAIEERCKTDADFKSAMGVTNKKPVIVAFGRRLYALAAVLALLLGFVGIRLIFNGSEVSFATVETCYADSEPLTGESGRLQSIERMKKSRIRLLQGLRLSAGLMKEISRFLMSMIRLRKQLTRMKRLLRKKTSVNLLWLRVIATGLQNATDQ